MRLTRAEGKMVDFGMGRAFLELRGIVRDPAKLEDRCRNMMNDGKRKAYFAKVTAGGRVTIPAPLRKELGINQDFVAIERLGDDVLIGPIKTLNGWYHACFGKDAMEKGVTWEAAEKALGKAGPKIMDELYGARQGGEGCPDGGRKPSKKMMSKESIRCPCGCRTKPRMFWVKGFDIRGSECPKCGEAFLNGEDANRYLTFNKLQHWILERIDPDYGLELNARTKRELARSRAQVQGGRTHTLEEVKKEPGL